MSMTAQDNRSVAVKEGVRTPRKASVAEMPIELSIGICAIVDAKY